MRTSYFHGTFGQKLISSALYSCVLCNVALKEEYCAILWHAKVQLQSLIPSLSQGPSLRQLSVDFLHTWLFLSAWLKISISILQKQLYAA